MRIRLRRFTGQADQIENLTVKSTKKLKGVFIEPHMQELLNAHVIDETTARMLSAMECIISA